MHPLARADSPGENVGAAGGERGSYAGRQAQPISCSLSRALHNHLDTKKPTEISLPPWYFHTPPFHLSLLQPPPISRTHMQKRTNSLMTYCNMGHGSANIWERGMVGMATTGWRYTSFFPRPEWCLTNSPLSQKALGDLESQLQVFFTPPTPQRDQCTGDYGAGKGGELCGEHSDDKADINHLFVTH